MGTRIQKLRRYAPISILTLVLLSGFYSLLHSSWQSDEVTLSEKRFSRLKSSLPRFGQVQYLTDPVDFRIDVQTDPQRTMEYFLAQYALCPLVLTTNDSKLAIANFSRNPRNASQILAKRYPAAVVKDFGSGLLLVQQK